ncbi:MAG: zinc ribbon domain-containing protein [Lachnospiraceae bacterium]|nr:zinc ribbon domain-containing protein [Lachnospiraceae bacterium]
MYCTHCGKQIEDNSKFCPYCGNSLSTSDTESVREVLKKTASVVMDSAKAIGNDVNEATGGQAGKYAEKAKETAKCFTDDVKQVAKDKDTSNFFTKNKYRNVKIIAVVLIAVFLLSSLFGEDKGEKMAKNTVLATFSNCDIKSATKVTGNDEGQIYIVKFIFSSGDESSAVVLITDDNASLVDVYPKSEYSRMEVFIELLKKQLE